MVTSIIINTVFKLLQGETPTVRENRIYQYADERSGFLCYFGKCTLTVCSLVNICNNSNIHGNSLIEVASEESCNQERAQTEALAWRMIAVWWCGKCQYFSTLALDNTCYFIFGRRVKCQNYLSWWIVTVRSSRFFLWIYLGKNLLFQPADIGCFLNPILILYRPLIDKAGYQLIRLSLKMKQWFYYTGRQRVFERIRSFLQLLIFKRKSYVIFQTHKAVFKLQGKLDIFFIYNLFSEFITLPRHKKFQVIKK